MFTLLLFITVVAAVRGLWSPCGLSMLSALNPVSERARGHRFWFTAAWYLLGAVVGGAVLGAALAVGALGVGELHPSPATVWLLALLAASIAAISDARVGGWTLPLHPRQVDERWLVRYRRWIYAAGFGVQIGTGFATYIMTAGVYLVAALAVLTANPAQALAAGLLFGLVRGLGIAVAGVAKDPDRLARLLGWVEARAGASVLLAFGACVAVAGAAAWQLGGIGVAAGVSVALGVGFAGLWADRAVREPQKQAG